MSPPTRFANLRLAILLFRLVTAYVVRYFSTLAMVIRDSSIIFDHSDSVKERKKKKANVLNESSLITYSEIYFNYLSKETQVELTRGGARREERGEK